MSKNPNLPELLRACLLCAVMACVLSFLLPNSAHGQIYGGGSSGGGTTTGCSGATNASAGGIVWNPTTATCASDGLVTRDASGNVTAVSVTAPVATHSTSVNTPLLQSTSTLSIRSQGAPTDGATVTNNLWNFNGVVTGTNGNASGAGSGFKLAGGVSFIGQAQTNRLDIVDNSGNNFIIAINGTYLNLNSNTTPLVLGSSQDTFLSRCAASVWCLGSTSGGTDGSIKGVTTNSSAPALSIGEFVTSSVASTGATVSISSGTPVTVVSTGAIVTAGDWDVTGVVCYITQVNTSITFLSQGVSTTTNTMGALGSYTADQMAAMVPLATASQEICKPVPATRVSLSGTSNVFLITKSAFTVGTLVGYGSMRLRRVR